GDGGLVTHQRLEDDCCVVGFPGQALVADHFVRIDDRAPEVVLVDSVQGLPWELAAIQVSYAVRLKQGVDALVVCAGQGRSSEVMRDRVGARRVRCTPCPQAQ